MILIVDDQYEGFESLKKQIERLQPEPVIFKHPDEVMPFLADHAMDVHWMMIDQVFDRCVYEKGMDLGRDIVNNYEYLPLVMYTANDYETPTAVEALARVGFSYFFDKNEIAKDDVKEDKQGNVSMITAEQMLKRHLDDIGTLPGFRQKAMLRAVRKERIIADRLSELNEQEINRLTKELNDPSGLSKYLFKFSDQEISMEELFKGWRDAKALSDQQLADEIRKSKILPTRFCFQEETWQRLFEEYQAAPAYPQKKWKRDMEALDVLLELMAHDKKAELQQSPIFHIKSNPEHLNVNFGNKKTSEELIFASKMVARRVMVAYTFVIKSISIEEMLPLLKSGHNDPAIIRPKSTKQGMVNKDGMRDIYPFYRTYLELSVNKKTIVNNDDKILVEEVEFKRFVKANASECYALLNELMMDVKSEIRTIGNLKRLLKEFKDLGMDTYEKWTAQLEEARQDSTAGLKHIIDYILKD
jgi:hypothetical protein